MGTESDSVQGDAERMAASEEAPDAGDSPPAPPGKKDSPWNSLEWAKLGVTILIPVSILVAGQLFAQHQREADDQKARREAIQKLSRSSWSAGVGPSWFTPRWCGRARRAR